MEGSIDRPQVAIASSSEYFAINKTSVLDAASKLINNLTAELSIAFCCFSDAIVKRRGIDLICNQNRCDFSSVDALAE
jgi:hypothetical protein